MPEIPCLTRHVVGGVGFWTDDELAHRGVRIAFSERAGGVSSGCFESLNLAAHVDDEPHSVDENRRRFLVAVGLDGLVPRLIVPEQVHGDCIGVVTVDEAGSGAFASAGRSPIVGTDALVTRATEVPIMLCFADCVPVVLVSPSGGIAVAHAGWRGALAGIAGSTARKLASTTGCESRELIAYIGAHIGACHYEVDHELMSQFCNTFGTVARAKSGGLDLDTAVSASLVDAGVTPCSIARLGTCTAEATDRFFSHRAENGCTGRHAALACVLSDASSASL